MSDVRVGILERLFQIAVVLGRATEDVAKLPGNMTVTLASVYFTTTCDLRNLLRPKIYVKLIQLRHLFYWRNNGKNQLHLSDRNVCLIFFRIPRKIFGDLQGPLLGLRPLLGNLVFASLSETCYCNLLQMLVVEKLLLMAPVLQLKAKYKSDTRLLRDVARSYMYCISNIKMSASLAKLHRANSTSNGSSWEEVNMS